MADGLPPMREVIARHGLSAKKALGQNFLLDLNVTHRIARAAGPLDGVVVIEIGPGPGGLTRALLAEGAAHVVAIEADDRCAPVLDEIADAYPGRLTPVIGDALQIHAYAHIPPERAQCPVRIIANLPYSVGTPLLIGWLSEEPWPPRYDRLVLMFQKEVAERITAEANTDAYGRLSVLAQWRTEPRILFYLPARAFTPAPKVDSAVVALTPRQHPLQAGDRRALESVTQAAFGQRRKMLRASLKSLLPDPVGFLEAMGIDPTRRAETLSVAEFCRLSEAWWHLKADVAAKRDG